jgi:transposase-like protein
MTDSNVTKELEKKLLSFITEEDPMLSMLQWITEKFMEIEVANKVGAQKGEHSTERTTHLSGTRVRRFDTRMGTMYLTIPKLRKGGYVPFFVTAKKRSEQALMQIIQEAWVSGISTRKIERLAKSMGIEQISASQVSEVNKELDAMVDEFRNRPLQAEYPILWIDALYEKIRENGHVVSMAVLVVKGVTLDGTAQILAVEPMHNESEETYRVLFQKSEKSGSQTGLVMYQ